MGLDTVELVIRFEEAFGISISDESAERLTTPGEVIEYVMTQVSVDDQPACLSQQAFYFLREKFTKRLHLPRRALRPATFLEALMPKDGRKLVWAELRCEIGVAALPDLARPAWLFSLLALGTVVVAIQITLAIMEQLKTGFLIAGLGGVLAAAVVGHAAAVLTRPLKNEFRRGYSHVGDLAQHLAFDSPHTFKRQGRPWTREQIAKVVREIIIDQTSVTDFTESSRFIDDMHLD